MTSPRSHAELVTLRKLAQDLAAQRKERLSSVHLLAAIALSGGPAADLLRDRRLDDEALLKATRSVDDEGPDPIGRAMGGARDVAKRATAKEPAALHLLLALLSDRSSAAHRALTQSGVDLGRLRTAALQIALGVVQARRTPARLLQDGGAPETPPAPAAATTARRARGEAADPARTPRAPRTSQELRPARGAGVAIPEPRPARGAGVAVPEPRPARGAGAPESRPAKGAGPGVTVPLFPPTPLFPPGRPRPAAAPADALAAAEPIALTPTPSPASSASPAPASAASPAAPAPGRPLPPLAPPTATSAAASAALAARFTLDRARFPALASLGHNLSLAAVQGELEPIVGREHEIEQALDVLAKRHANNPCLLGPAGVGKTSVARGVAHRLAFDEREPRVVVELVPSELLAGTGARGALSERLSALRSEVREAGGRVILFIDGLSELFGSGALDEAMAEIKLALARGELTMIGTATPEEYRKSIEVDPALARRFTIVEIDEPEEDEAFLLLQSVAVGLGAHHGLAFTDEALASAVAWSVRYLPGRALPDKALSILDLAGARTRRRASSASRASRASRTSHAAHAALHEPAQPARQVGPAEVAEVVSELADLPVERLLETDRERMLSLETLLAENVVGHGEALSRIARVLRRNAAGLRARRPIGSFLLLGPTGVGKTETAKAIAEALFHSPDAMTRLDFSEYAESHAVARLVGAPPGYVGHEAGGQLTEAVRRRPYQVVLLDEIEKAHRDVLEAFLQVFDEGRLTDGRGRRVDFTNTVLVMTSNLGAAEAGALRSERSVGFARSSSAVSPERLGETMLSAARAALPPELYNRIDEVLCFAPLTRADVAEITRRLLGGLERELEARGVELEVEPEAIDALLDAGGFDPELGARPMKRTIARLVEAPLAELILRGQLEEGSAALVGVEQGEVVVDAIARAGERRYAACSS
ncbi:endopeptidase ATPase with chaperone activity,two ATP-bindingdomains [Sorangium cellulosum So ce56]|uniref:Endopeptidase ATPase with chaperone activity,two ATP-bindingdomains n=1 Tax=Sorangium cellulosum (strain So ce56) TaxID=448385 RepID=A9FU98_SORC5|nr:ATP-dependent Clp protease ATP-binding subunit [Sorangium cellulosum]CAN98611.1 endopeptidase ATPase with chaperone activity,two ATP-bindingdomains [Sorangium cellulosum So ce56]